MTTTEDILKRVGNVSRKVIELVHELEDIETILEAKIEGDKNNESRKLDS